MARTLSSFDFLPAALLVVRLQNNKLKSAQQQGIRLSSSCGFQGSIEPGVVADGSRLQKGYRSMGRGKGRVQGARKRARG
jgi:hypothetical protein